MRLTFVLAISLLLAPSVVVAETTPTPPAIAQAIKDLGANRLETRVAAREFLWKLGKVAYPALEAAAKSNDLEVSATARHLLDRIELGLSAEMPAELIQAAETFRFGSEEDKLRVLPVLARYQATIVLWRLASRETPGRLRTQTFEAAWKARYPLARIWLATGDFAKLEDFVKELSTVTGDNRDYACYLTLRGQADERIKALQAAPKRSNEMKLLALLLRLKGDLPAAVKAATQSGDEDLERDLLVELGDWQGVRALSVPTSIRDKSVWLASVYRLAGDKDGLEEQIKSLKIEAETRQLASAFQSLEINDHTADAIHLRGSRNVVQKMSDLALQGRMLEALACVGIDKSQGSYLDWLHGYYPQLELGKVDGQAWAKNPEGSTDQVYYEAALETAVILVRVGRHEAAIELVDKLAEATKPHDQRNQLELFKTYRKLRCPPQAFVHGLRVLELVKSDSGFDQLYGRGANSQAVRFWWDLLSRDSQEKPSPQRLSLADELAYASLRLPPANKPSLKFLRRAELLVGKQKPLERIDEQLQLAQTCDRYGYKQLAIDVLSRAATESRSANVNMQLGTMLFGQKQWASAAERFALAFQQDPSQIRARYMRGCSLLRAGQQRAGEYELELAQLSLLADVAKRNEIAQLLYSLELYREAADEWERIMRFSGCTTTDAFNANQGLGHTASFFNDAAAAARYWERCTLNAADFSFADPAAMIRLGHVIHRTQARALIEAGEMDRALAEAALGFESMPGDVDLPTTLVPLLEAAGRIDAAEQVFERTYQFYQGILRRFPDSSYHLNSAAWLAAVCHRRLDEALKMSQQAVALEPEYWAYLDTLAEVFFQLGDRDQALQWAAKISTLEPGNKQVEKRLEHFRHDPLPRRN
ncbi:MAG TPA: hypothetical protein VHV55_09650 [Pirellulales bacterium]|jgi:hypothetical protein|nr:hypothetical protein [Pirellulales bacterium]